jgi:hypothetical protein
VLANPSQINGDNLQNLRRETKEHIGIRKVNISRTKLMSLKLIIKTKV